jgi:predicted dehydrogenase
MTKLRLGLIGCGAVAEALHLPAIRRSNLVELTAVVEQSDRRRLKIASEYQVPLHFRDYRDLMGSVDAVIVALPNHLHASVSIHLLKKGIHVLVEKPMALNSEECRTMINAQLEGQSVLAVGLVRRFYRTTNYVKEVLDSHLLGAMTAFHFSEGTVLDWNATSNYMFRKESSGGGVLIDVGVHVLDLLQFWLGEVNAIDYFDDAMGGVEADCECRIEMKDGLKGIIELSRTRNLNNLYLFKGEKGVLEVGTSVNPSVSLHVAGATLKLTGKILSDGQSDTAMTDAFVRQIDDFAESIVARRNPLVSGEIGIRSLRLVEECYHNRKLLRYPWVFCEINAD